MIDVSAIVTFEEGVTKTVPAAELSISAIPDMEQPGVKTLVVIYNKTLKGENCDKPIMANTTFEVVEQIASIEVTTPPRAHNTIITPRSYREFGEPDDGLRPDRYGGYSNLHRPKYKNH